MTAVNLINVKRIGRRNNNMQWFKVPAKTYFEPNAIQYLRDMEDVERVTIVTDATMTRIGIVDKVIDVLQRRNNNVSLQIIDNVEPEPSIATVKAGAEVLRAFKPDTIIAVGGGSPMDAAKVMWLLYEHPEVNFADLKEKFFDVRKRAFKFPVLGELAQLVCIPTTSGTGAEVTPFAVISDPDAGHPDRRPAALLRRLSSGPRPQPGLARGPRHDRVRLRLRLRTHDHPQTALRTAPRAGRPDGKKVGKCPHFGRSRVRW